MSRCRRVLGEVVAGHDLQIVAASTHPLGIWQDQLITEKRRYDQLMSDFRIISQRNLVCGLHIHVAIPEEVDRVDVMNRAMRWLPVFLALSTSSPFWNRSMTGLMSYRQAAYDEWPRTGVPDHFKDEAEYAQFVARLVAGGAIKNASFLWWAIRPALRFPTLELRICDTCTRLDDTLAITALFRCLVRMLVRRPDLALDWTPFTRRLIDENRWRAKRFGTDALFISEDGSPARSCKKVAEELLELVAEDARALGCEAELARIRALLVEGTSAHCQVKLFRAFRARGDTPAKAMQSVVDWLIASTMPVR
jgi:carboxylate-amine ligase